MRYVGIGVLLASVIHCATAAAQSPRTLYTWAGTGDVANWVAEGNTNSGTPMNTTPGVLTIQELGDPLSGIEGGAIVIRDGHNRRFESSTDQGGLDVTGLEAIEFDLQHNGSGNVNVQFYLQATPDYNYVWAGSDGTLNGPDFSLAPNELHTLRFPLSLLTPAQQTYIRAIGLSVRDHQDIGNVTWQLHEMRSIGEPLTERVLATHDAGTSEGGLQGAFVNFENGAVVGNDGGQNQTGLSHNPELGTLRWTDRGGTGETGSPSGAAVTWGNGTIFVHDCCGPNSFNERLSDFSNYDTVTFRMSASDPLGGGGVLGLQQFFQTGSFVFQESGVEQLPIDGQFHDLTFSLAGVTNRENSQVFGLNLFTHPNNLVIDVDQITFNTVVGVPGDYNGNGVVDTADYTVWRDNLGGTTLANEGTSPGVVDVEDYNFWKSNFGNGGGGALAGQVAVPEPGALAIVMLAVGGLSLVASRGV